MKCKILLLYGDDDNIIPKVALEQMKELFGDKLKFVEFENTGHGLFQVHPKKSSEIVVEFLNAKE